MAEIKKNDLRLTHLRNKRRISDRMRGFAGDWAIGETTKKVESKQRSQMGIVSCGDSTACVNVIASLKRGMINTKESIYNLKVHPKISVSIEVLLLNNVNYMIQINIISFQIL